MLIDLDKRLKLLDERVDDILEMMKIQNDINKLTYFTDARGKYAKD